jgi:hypothetical protein
VVNAIGQRLASRDSLDDFARPAAVWTLTAALDFALASAIRANILTGSRGTHCLTWNVPPAHSVAGWGGYEAGEWRRYMAGLSRLAIILYP